MNSLTLGFMLILLINVSYGFRYDICTLANELIRNGIQYYELSDWVCLAQYASGLDGNKVYRNNRDGSWDWGIFQINDRQWCSNPQRRGHPFQMSNRCGIDCNYLLNNLQQSIRCGRKLLQSSGFQGSIAWRNNCQYNKISVRRCFP